jgi:hypothetical protein
MSMGGLVLKEEKKAWLGIWFGKEKKKKSKIICDEIFEFFHKIFILWCKTQKTANVQQGECAGLWRGK